MRAAIIALLMFASCCPNGFAADIPDAPPAWDAQYWLRGVRAAWSAHDRGDNIEADQWCEVAVTHAESHVLTALDEYADLLQSTHDASAREVRGHAKRLRDVMQGRLIPGGPKNSYLGFDPAAALQAYADLLAQVDRLAYAEQVRVLAVAYRHAQSTYIQRMLITQRGMDPAGECCVSDPAHNGCPQLP